MPHSARYGKRSVLVLTLVAGFGLSVPQVPAGESVAPPALPAAPADLPPLLTSAAGSAETCPPAVYQPDSICQPRATNNLYGRNTLLGHRWSEDFLYQPFTAWQYKPGSERVLGDGQIMLPLWQTDESLLFADIRGQMDDSQSREGNWGLGLRQIQDSGWIAGAYAFYDLRETELNNNFEQLTLGFEALAVDWEARVNGYLPESDVKAAPATAAIQNGTIVVMGGSERAYYGVDAEIGVLLSEWCGGDVELRGYAGGFHFDNDARGFRNMSGPRARLELRAYDLAWLGEQSRVTLGAEWQWDQVRDDQVFAMLRVRIPLGFSGGSQPRLNRLQRRMLDRIVRDVDVVSQAPADVSQPAMFADDGQMVGSLTIIDANTPDPAAAVAGAGKNSTVVVSGDKGTIHTATTVQLQYGQTVRGGGVTIVGAQSGARTTFGSRPTVNSTADDQAVFEVADNSTLRDIDATGGHTGVEADGVSGFTISGLDISPLESGVVITNGSSGFTLTGDGESEGFNLDVEIADGTTIAGNTATGHNHGGFYFGNAITGGTITSNTASGSHGGFYFNDAITGGMISHNTASSNTTDGFSFSGEISGGTISSNTATGNTRYGFGFESEISGGTISGNTARDNSAGFLVSQQFTGGSLTGNTATGSSAMGFAFLQEVSGGEITGNTSATNGGAGFLFFSVSSGSITGNTSRDNTASGFQFKTEITDGTTIADNTATGNGLRGFMFAEDLTGGTITGNTASGNESAGFEFEDVSGGTISSNTASGNGAYGFRFTDISGGTISSNTASMNSEWGLAFGDISGGIISSNTASMNGRDGLGFGDISGGTISSNTASMNSDRGFAFGDISGGTITGNTASGNTSYGLWFGAITGGTISGNTAQDNDAGFHMTGQFTGGGLTGNTATGNTTDGFLFKNGVSGGEISGNTASGNSGDGFDVSEFGGGNTATFSDNTATDNDGAGYNIGSGTPQTGGNNTGSGNGSLNTGP